MSDQISRLQEQLSEAVRDAEDYKAEAKHLRRYKFIVQELLLWDGQGRPAHSSQLDRTLDLARDLEN